jgi:hypothetical protein
VLTVFKSTSEVHSMWHNIWVVTMTVGKMWAVGFYSVPLHKSDSSMRDIFCYSQILPQ